MATASGTLSPSAHAMSSAANARLLAWLFLYNSGEIPAPRTDSHGDDGSADVLDVDSAANCVRNSGFTKFDSPEKIVRIGRLHDQQQQQRQSTVNNNTSQTTVGVVLNVVSST